MPRDGRESRCRGFEEDYGLMRMGLLLLYIQQCLRDHKVTRARHQTLELTQGSALSSGPRDQGNRSLKMSA